ncbi:MAG: hypothetical protein R3Y58_14200 [Eubacteriales bacterium]
MELEFIEDFKVIIEDLKVILGMLKDVGLATWCGLLTFIVITVIQVKICNKYSLLNRLQVNIEKAKVEGHVLEGKRIKLVQTRRKHKKGNERRYISTYEYIYNGQTYTGKVSTLHARPPVNVEFYYKNNPNKVFTEYSRNVNVLHLLLYIIPLGIACLVFAGMGGLN